MLRRDAPAGSGAVPPPEEVKLYAQRAACDIHPWADLLDVCRIGLPPAVGRACWLAGWDAGSPATNLS